MANDGSKLNIQDQFLNKLRRTKIPATIVVMNGYQINHAIVMGYDNYAIVVISDKKEMLIYKHAISSVIPEKQLSESEIELDVK